MFNSSQNKIQPKKINSSQQMYLIPAEKITPAQIINSSHIFFVEHWLFFCPTTQFLFTKELIPAGKFFDSSRKIKSSPKN